eukprot:gene15691-17607_t
MSRQASPADGCKATKEGLMESKHKFDETDDCPNCKEDWNVLCRVSNHPSRQQQVGGNPSTPGDAEVMFLVLKLTRGKGKKNKGEIISAVPVGTSFALSDKLLFTAAHNVCNSEHVALGEIGVVRVYENPVLMADIVILTHENHCCDKDEDW